MMDMMNRVRLNQAISPSSMDLYAGIHEWISF